MKISFRAALIITGVLLLGSCMMHYSMNPLFQIKPDIPQYDVANLPDIHSAGARHYRRYCSQCHILPNPQMYTAPEWQRIVSRMVERMRAHMAMANAPSAEKEQLIRDYLARYGLQALDASDGINLASQEGQLFQKTCSRCHALPSPAQHTAAEWPEVVTRMAGNMRVMGTTVPSASELAVIVAFLQQASGADKKQHDAGN